MAATDQDLIPKQTKNSVGETIETKASHSMLRPLSGSLGELLDEAYGLRIQECRRAGVRDS